MSEQESQAQVAAAIADGARLLPESIAKLADSLCCSSELAWQWVLDHLRVKARDSGEKWHNLDSGPEWIAAEFVDSCGLTDWGVSLPGAWLTPEGKEALAFLEEYGANWEDKHHFVSADGTSWGKVFK